MEKSMNGNSFMTFMLRSPLHGIMSGSTMLITVTGRKSGRPITTPVNYYQEGNTLWVISNRERTWWRNLKGGASLKLRLRGQEVNGFGEVLLDEPAVAVQIGEYVRHLPISARSLGVHMQEGQPDPADLRRLAQERVVIRIKLA
jgi:deazaflavin-dependent oxidoreductase (nitroreductase family)